MCDPSVPSRVRWLLRYALWAPACSQRRSGKMQDTNPGNGPAVSSLNNWRTRRELHPQPSRRQSRMGGTLAQDWQAASVPPRVSGVLETLPRADAQPFAEGTRQSHVVNHKWNGAAAGSCTRTSSVAGRHSAVKSQPLCWLIVDC
jgi:hypothetical protein